LTISYIAEKLSSCQNIIDMVTAETQELADIRIPALLESSFAIKGVSIEPMLEPVNLQPWLICQKTLDECHAKGLFPNCNITDNFCSTGLNWVICGGESGKGARPCYPDWVKKLYSQCINAKVPFFSSNGEHGKQNGCRKTSLTLIICGRGNK